ncbi:MAG: hydrogenase large subunit domain protein [Pelosinus sp.]|jgi:[FeFe] hydrogenase (group B1/B3)|nr:hydrogenase large subunit domain protein [Pelosinus sp.]
MLHLTEVIKIRRKVMSQIAKLAFEGELDKENIGDILDNIVTEDGPRYRCCVHKERAVVKDRVRFILAQSVDVGISEAAINALNGQIADTPIINIMPEACDQCPIDTFFITNACRNCVAHNCIASCPKNAISVVQNQAYIDKTRCIECGLCKKSCMYGAIVEITRPCERACEIGAIKADKERRAVINYEKCVQCGGCKVACPFGAITEQSFIVHIIQQIKAGRRVYAILAPAFISQFGLKVTPSQVVNAIKRIGFYDVKEVSFGADIVTLEEAKEFSKTVPETHSFMTTSCCPAFVGMLEKHLPELKGHISTTVSPMVATGKVIKEADPEAVIVFIGPCLAKKVEARQYSDTIDFVLTFEEMDALFVGAGISPIDIDEAEFATTASRDGNAFAKAGGVIQAVIDAAEKIAPDLVVKPHRAEGLQNCKMALLQMKSGKIDANFFEGMACNGGCVGGPGILIDTRIGSKMVEKFADSSSMVTALENQEAIDESKKDIHWHNK